jgi:SPP1 family predicted phage head-tail adaptor
MAGRRVTSPEVWSGDLDRRISLLRPLFNQWQDEIIGWEKVADVWAGFNSTYGYEIMASLRTIMIVQITVVIRYRNDIDQRWRLKDEQGITYEINGMLNTLNRYSQWQLLCTRVD